MIEFRAQHIMFDIDGTLLSSCAFDSEYYEQAIIDQTGFPLHEDRTRYVHVSDEGILRQHLQENNLDSTKSAISNAVASVKTDFIHKIKKHLSSHPTSVIPGAVEMLDFFFNRPEFTVSFATGGWAETAKMKLQSAGIDIGETAFASSNDHFDRCEIMRTALKRTDLVEAMPVTYIGDGLWDKVASNTLNWNFVLVGDKTEHHQAINDFSEIDTLLQYLHTA